MQYSSTINEIIRLEGEITTGNRALSSASIPSVRYQYIGQLSVAGIQRLIDNDPGYEDTIAGRLQNQLSQAQAANTEIQGRLQQLGLSASSAQPYNWTAVGVVAVALLLALTK